jgi:hypothetical protein
MFSSRPELGWQEVSLTVKKKNETGGIGTEGAPKETLGARLRHLAEAQRLNPCRGILQGRGSGEAGVG